jgi:integrase
VAVACTTGWRKGSFDALRWGDVDLHVGHIDTARTKNGTPHRAPLLPWVVAELARIRPTDPSPTAPVFGCRNITKAWQTALKRADLPEDWTFHHCRHIAASILAQSGASVPQIMATLNHKSPNMSLRYSHLNVASQRQCLATAWEGA